jgi:hypothetical protein
MNILPEIIGLLSKEEARNFKLFAYQTNAGAERKDVLLFDYIKKNYPDQDEEKIFKKLYKESDKNAFYRLKNRLIEDIGISLAQLHYNSSEINTILNTYLLAKLFISKNKSSLALYYLGKSEKKALSIESFELLDLIYNEYIKLSHEVLEINPEDYISKRKENHAKLNRLQEIDDVLAVVIYRIKTSQNFSRGNEKINELLHTTVNTFSKSREVKNSPLLRFKIYHSVSRILLQQHNFKALEKYLLKTYSEFNKENLFTRNNHDTRLQMLTYIANALFKNNKVNESLHYVKELHSAMQEYSGLLHDKYLFFYYNILVNNYAKTNVEKAIEILNEAREEKVIRNHPVYIGFVYLNLAVSFFGIKNFKSSLRSIVKLYMLDSYKTLDEAFRFKISVTELIIRYELNDIDYIEQRIQQIRKEFKTLLQQEEFGREAGLIDIISKMIVSSMLKSDKKLIETIRSFTRKTKNADPEGGEILDYSDWLNEKIH